MKTQRERSDGLTLVFRGSPNHQTGFLAMPMKGAQILANAWDNHAGFPVRTKERQSRLYEHHNEMRLQAVLSGAGNESVLHKDIDLEIVSPITIGRAHTLSL